MMGRGKFDFIVPIWSRDGTSKDNHERLFHTSDKPEQTITCSSGVTDSFSVCKFADINMWAHGQKWLKSQGKFHNKEESANASNTRIR